MGGSDPNNLTKILIEAIGQLSNPECETLVLLGGSNPHLRSVEASIQRVASIRLVIDATNVPEMMAWADVAVAGAGTTFWEMCFLGLPSILLVAAENQKGVAAAANEMGIACSLGNGNEVTASAIAGKLADLLSAQETRTKQSANGGELIDGRGAERVLAFLSDLSLRRTRACDCEVFWEWANEPGARAASFRNKTISWEQHTQWFQAKLSDPKAILYTATNREGLPIGEVRYQVNGGRAVISIGMGAPYRGCGWGRKILALGIARLFQDSTVQFIDAYVKPSNEASLRLFVGAGFMQLPEVVIEEQAAIHFVLGRDGVV